MKKNNTTKEEIITKIKQWYNGFCFDPEVRVENKVYNPFSTLLLFTEQEFRNYWFDSGSPKFLIDLLKSSDYDLTRLDGIEAGQMRFDSYDPEDLDIEALLLQTGYLTLKERLSEDMYMLGYPNKEIERSFDAYLIEAYTGIDRGESQVYVYKMRKMLEERPPEFGEFVEKVNEFLEKVPYDMTDKLKDREQHYQSMLYLIISMLGLEVMGEAKTARGRIDLMFKVKDEIGIIMELKLNRSAAEAIEQIRQKDYAAVYRGKVKRIYFVGINVSTEERRISEWKVEEEPLA